MWDYIKNKVKTAWDGFWGFFKNSGTIFLARLEVFVGFLIASIGFMDWAPMLAAGVETGFTWTQAAVIGSIMFVKGMITEIVRMRGTKEVEGHLVPTAAALEETNIKVVTKTKKK